MKTAIVIPAYNQENTIASLIDSIKSQFDVGVIVVNDRSSDNTEYLSEKAGAEVLNLEEKAGYNTAIHRGLDMAIESGYKYAITMDADGQHPPEKLHKFFELFENGDQFVFGFRPTGARWAEKIFAKWAFKKYGILDPLCGMKGYDLDELGKFFRLPTFNSVGTEIMMNVVQDEFKWGQVAIPEVAREDNPRFGNGLKPNLTILVVFLRFVLWSLIFGRYKSFSRIDDV